MNRNAFFLSLTSIVGIIIIVLVVAITDPKSKQTAAYKSCVETETVTLNGAMFDCKIRKRESE